MKLIKLNELQKEQEQERGKKSGLPSTEESKGEKLFLYRQANKFTKRIVSEQELYFSSPVNFNDPFECYTEIVTHKDDIIKRGILCFSAEKADPKINTLMWSHYADKHKGICFEFKNNKDNKFKLLYNNNENVECEIEKVKHDTANPILLLTKDKAWKYEDEWRIILDYEKIKENNYSRTFKFDAKCLEAIYFGINASDELINEYINCLKECIWKGFTINLYKMEMSKPYLFKEPERIKY